MNGNILKTGSRAQDALRAGFQVTCSKGLAKLLKLDDITEKSCEDFKEQHKKDVELELRSIVDDVEESLTDEFMYYTDSSWLKGIDMLFSLQANRQKPRKNTITVNKVHKPHLDLNIGKWFTDIELIVQKHAWKGWYKGKRTELEEKTKSITKQVVTDAMVASLKFTNYDTYCDKYIPNEAVEVVNDAIEIGLTDIKVVEPRVDSSVTDYDPIIVGNIESTMYLLVWFGYDKTEPMQCNM